MKDSSVRARIDSGLKKDVEDILDHLGLNTTQAISLFFHQISLRKGLPFDVMIPNEETQKVFQETDEGKNLVECRDADDLFKKLGL
jgi:DNA-damage-inducible protein J